MPEKPNMSSQAKAFISTQTAISKHHEFSKHRQADTNDLLAESPSLEHRSPD